MTLHLRSKDDVAIGGRVYSPRCAQLFTLPLLNRFPALEHVQGLEVQKHTPLAALSFGGVFALPTLCRGHLLPDG